MRSTSAKVRARVEVVRETGFIVSPASNPARRRSPHSDPHPSENSSESGREFLFGFVTLELRHRFRSGDLHPPGQSVLTARGELPARQTTVHWQNTREATQGASGAHRNAKLGLPAQNDTGACGCTERQLIQCIHHDLSVESIAVSITRQSVWPGAPRRAEKALRQRGDRQ